MTRLSEHPATFIPRRSGSVQLTAQEQATIFAAREILARHINRNPVLSSWAALMDYCALVVRGEVERFHVLYLDRKNRLISDERLGVGTVDHVPVYPREVVRRALEVSASAVILVHNHPSGDQTPSSADIEMTRKIIDAARTLGIAVHDHVIVGRAEVASFKALGLI